MVMYISILLQGTRTFYSTQNLDFRKIPLCMKFLNELVVVNLEISLG